MRQLALVLAAGASLAAAPAAAQADSTARDTRARTSGGGSLVYARPAGEFAEYVNQGVGLNGNLLLRLDRAGAIALRLDGGFLVYGNERVSVRSPFGGRLRFDVRTMNNIAFFGVGPQLMVPTGRVRPYVNGTAGLAYFYTQSSVEGSANDNQPFARTTNKSDVNLAYTAGGGIYVPLSVGRRPLSLDVGASYHGNGTAEYLRKGSIRDRPDGGVDIDEIRSETNFMTYRVGVSVGFR